MGFWSWIGLAEKKEIAELQSSVRLLIEENQLLREDNKKLFEYISASKNKCVDEVLQQLRIERECISISLQVTNSEIGGLAETIDCIQGEINELKTLQNSNYDEIVKRLVDFQQNVIEIIEVLKKLIKFELDGFQKKSEENKNVIIESFRTHHEMYLSTVENMLAEMKKSDTELSNCLSRIKEQNDGIVQDVLTNKEILTNNSDQLANLAALSGSIDRKTDSIEEMQRKTGLLAESVQNLWAIMKAIWVDSVLSDIDSMG